MRYKWNLISSLSQESNFLWPQQMLKMVHVWTFLLIVSDVVCVIFVVKSFVPEW